MVEVRGQRPPYESDLPGGNRSPFRTNDSMAHTFKSVGFIGLGLMGMPMLENLIKKLPDTTRFFVYDVSAATTDSICSRYGARVKACENARDVADQAVCKARLAYTRWHGDG